MSLVRLPFSMSLMFIIHLGFFSALAQTNPSLLQLLPPSKTGIHFNNQLFESDTLNILNQANIYNGGGIGIGDFNKDGLMDVYFAGNMVSNKLYLNKSNLEFTDITKIANVDGQGRWSTGVTIVDINGDTWPDIYVSASFSSDPEKRTNLLYINKGLNKKGIPVFIESAQAYGLADDSFSTQGYFFDYDNDGDLDMYLVVNEIYDPKTPINFRAKLTDGSAKNTDRLFRNNGNETFSDVSKEAGIVIEGWGHAASITDLNSDGWPDIYVANDFVANDLCYMNNGDGTFTNRLEEYFKHTGWNAMGTDFSDLNNDGYVDMISLEMLPENNLRKKRMLGGNEYYTYINSARYKYTHQYVRNMLQMNSGPTPLGHPIFEDRGFMAGIYQTDWSWCPLIADFDNDGLRDVIITNGLPRDVTDMDYIAYDNGQSGVEQKYTLAMTDSLPIVKLANYAYKNVDGVLFEDSSKAWGLEALSFSNGGVYADLDNDGDLEVLINNINGTAFVYENTLNNTQNTISVRFEGTPANTMGLGAKLRIYYGDNQQQLYEHYPTRGYLSTNDPRAHLGLGKVQIIDSLVVVWSDEKVQTLRNVKTNQRITLSHKDALRQQKNTTNSAAKLFAEVSKRYELEYTPIENDFSDYTIQRTLPHKLSQYGPGIAVGDVDANGYEDFYLGGSSEHPGIFFMQDATGKFTIDDSRFAIKEDELYEDMGALFFDADQDNDLDLYVVSGSYEIPEGHEISNDRFFLNDGTGKFSRATDALPQDLSNGSCVKAADFDADGDLDLFIGGRVVSAGYPKAPRSFLLKNENGKFVDVTQEFMPELQTIGMVTDALWSDFDKDGKPDLIIAGEWMPVTFLKNTGTSFEKITSGIDARTGWWNSLVSGDFDADGDMDYIAGNLGLNSNYVATPEEPMTIIAKDIDENGLMDPMVFCYMTGDDGNRESFPIASRDDLVSQVLTMRKKYPTYTSYGLATMETIWNPTNLKNALVLQATEMRTSYIENLGNGKFEMKPLPMNAQEAPIYGMLAEDIDGDENLDVLLVGNDYGMDSYSGRHDAFSGLYLKGDGRGTFTTLALAQTDFFVDGDAKALAKIHAATDKDLFIVTQNQDPLRVFERLQENTVQWMDVREDDFSAELTYTNGRKKYTEFYYGATYLSQSSRKLPVEKNVVKITITNFKGQKRQVL